jgi:hypothetical protein
VLDSHIHLAKLNAGEMVTLECLRDVIGKHTFTSPRPDKVRDFSIRQYYHERGYPRRCSLVLRVTWTYNRFPELHRLVPLRESRRPLGRR